MNPKDLPTQSLYFGGGEGTLVTPLALCVLLVAAALMLLLPRKHMVVPFFLAGFLITVREQIVVAGLHFMVYRLLIFVGAVRIIWSAFLTRRDPFPSRMNFLDKALVLWAFTNAVTYTMLWGEFGAFVNRLGFLYTTFGVYFLLRYLIRDREDVIRTIKIWAVVSVVIAAFMLAEQLTGTNEFSIFGGVRLFSEVRNGWIRAQGPFLHAILAGTFGAMLFPLFIALWWEGKGHRLAAGFGMISSTAMMIASASSTPVMTYLAGLVGLCLWPVRKGMRAFRWGLVFSLVGLQTIMKAPVWFLISRVAGLTGGSGYHRSMLIDHFIRHFGEWWLVGTRNNMYWGYDMWDSINAYVNAGIEGGLVTFVLFIAVFACAYKRIGVARKLATNDRKNERLIWAVGATLFANTVAFFGITYFDQTIIAWYAILVMISAATAVVVDARHTQPEFEVALSSVSLRQSSPIV
jgi:hypothetical protein